MSTRRHVDRYTLSARCQYLQLLTKILCCRSSSDRLHDLILYSGVNVSVVVKNETMKYTFEAILLVNSH